MVTIRVSAFAPFRLCFIMTGKFASTWVMDLFEKAKQNKNEVISIIESTLGRDKWKDVSAMDRHYLDELYSDLTIGPRGHSMKTRSKPKPIGVSVLEARPEACLPPGIRPFQPATRG